MKNNKLTYRTVSLSCFILLMINYKFLYFVKMPGSFGSRSNLLLYLPASLVLLVICFILNTKRISFSFSNFLVFMFFILLLELFYSLFKYSDESILKQIIPYLSIVSYYIYSLYSQFNLKSFLKMLIIFSTVAAFICVFEVIINSFFGRSLFYVYGYNYGITTDFLNSVNSLRNGRFRLIGSDLIDFTAVISIGCLYTKKIKISRKLLWVNIISVAFYELFSSQVRSAFVYIFGTFLILNFIKGKSKLLKIFSSILGIIGIIFIIINIEKNIPTDYSYSNRLNEIVFYSQRFLKSPLFGNGLLPDSPKFLENYSLVHGPDIIGGYSYSDIGVIGLMGKLGVLGFFLYVTLLVKTLNICKKTKSALCLAIFIIMLFSAISLSLFDSERLVVLSILMAVCDGIEYGGENR